MKFQALIALPVGLLSLLPIGCSVATGVEEPLTTEESSDELTSCPAPSPLDDQMRASATLALTLMKDEAERCMPYTWTLPVMSILTPHRYRIRSSGFGIEFDPNDKLYSAVTDKMRGHLAIAQLDSSVATFLSDGLRYAYANTDGKVYPRLRGALALENYTYPGPVRTHIYDSASANASHYATVTGKPWCGTSMVTIADTVQQSWQYSPLDAVPITTNVGDVGGQWYTAAPAIFKGTKTTPWTPFNGKVTTGNPYLVVSVNGVKTNWSTYNFASVDCWKLPNHTCSGFVEIDPVPYAEPGEYYSSAGLVGTQANPFALANTVLYATPDHQGQWATRTVNGIKEWGVFANPVTLFGTTQYKYSKRF